MQIELTLTQIEKILELLTKEGKGKEKTFHTAFCNGLKHNISGQIAKSLNRAFKNDKKAIAASDNNTTKIKKIWKTIS